MKMKLAVIGLVLALSGNAQASELVTNGGFETGDFTGWTQTGNTSFNGVDGNGHSGIHAAFFGPVGSLGGISQNLTTVGGTSYLIDFFVQFDGGNTSQIQVAFGGDTLLNLNNPPAGGYIHESFVATASTSSTTLSFSFRDDPGFIYLDDVRVTAAVPEASTWAMMILGFAGVGFMAYRRRNQTVALAA